MTTLTFNRSLAAVVSKELHADVTEIRNGLSKTLPWDADCADRFDKLGRIAKTAQLRSVQKVFHAISESARKLNTQGTESLLEANTKLIQTLLAHLHELVQDHKNAPLRMARSLHAVLTQLGHQISPVMSAEMYMPFNPEDTSADRPSALPVSEFAAAIRDYRAAYQAGVIKLLKEGDASQYTVLRQSLVSIEPKNPHQGYRVFFEAAIAALDVLSKTHELDNLSKWVLSKIDPELNNIAHGSTKASDDLVSSILHLVAKADPAISIRVRKLQEHYNLKSYLADLNGIDPAIVEKFVQVLVKSREVWSQFAATEPHRVAKLVAELQSKSAILKNPGFSLVIDALHEVITVIASGSVAVNGEQLSLEGAGSLLVLEQQLREGSNLNTANLSASRLYALMGKTTTYVQNGTENQTATAILHVLAAQVLDDLNQLEPRLLELLNEQRDGEQELRNGLKKIAKVLNIFGKGNALSRSFELFEERLEVPAFTNEKAEVAARFTQLGTLVDSLKTSDKAALTASQRWIDGQVKVEEKVEGDDFKDMPNDSEMLEIFLEEATGILIDIERWYNQLRNDPSMHDTVVNLRRGYHTLKGSGRMVGLVRFGDLSYIGELLLNNWITSKKIPTPELLDYLKKSMDAISGHVSNFKLKGYAHVEFESHEQEALALGGTSLTEAPQSKRGNSIKLGSRTSTAVQPQAKPKTVAPQVQVAPVQTPVPTKEEPAVLPSFEFEPLPATNNVVEPSTASSLPELKLSDIPNFEPEPEHQPSSTIESLNFTVGPEEHHGSEQDLNFDILNTTTKGEQLVPELPPLPSLDLSKPTPKDVPASRTVNETPALAPSAQNERSILPALGELRLDTSKPQIQDTLRQAERTSTPPEKVVDNTVSSSAQPPRERRKAPEAWGRPSTEAKGPASPSQTSSVPTLKPKSTVPAKVVAPMVKKGFFARLWEKLFGKK